MGHTQSEFLLSNRNVIAHARQNWNGHSRLVTVKIMKKAQFVIMLVLILIFPLQVSSQSTLNYPESYRDLRLWDSSLNGCFFYQETSNSCVPASVQIVLKYLDFSPLPNQTDLAMEMHTTINHTTQLRYSYIPFDKRGVHDYYNESLSHDFNQALSNLKGNASQNLPIIINTWYDELAKQEGKVTHARVVTGYNESGIFFHDPGMGQNRFLNNSIFADLWKTDMGYWALIIKYQPRFELIVKITDVFGFPVSGVEVKLGNRINATESTDANGTAHFQDLQISQYTLTYNWWFITAQENLSVTQTATKNYKAFSDLTFAALIVIASLTVGLVVLARKKKTERWK